MSDYIIIGVSLLLAASGFLLRKMASKKRKSNEKPTKAQKWFMRFTTFLIVIGGYVMTTKLIELIFGKQQPKSIEVEIAVPRVDFFGFSLSTTVIYTWIIMAALIILALILRFTLIPKLKDVPTGTQNVLEIVIDSIIKYTKNTAHGVGEFLASYIFTIALFLIACSFTELIGFRTPASDITMTGALAILTFIIINYYGLKVKGIKGRLKSLASPSVIIFPIRLITDLAIPISLASRLFGNMLGGLVVMELLYMALGSYAIGIPGVAGLYFSVFHPLIQAFIFVTLTLTFINEATE